MDYMYQVMNQVLNVAETSQKLASKPAEKKSGDDGKDFDSMVRQKRAEGKKPDRGMEKKNASTKDKGAGWKQKEPQVTEEQYAAAAAMLLQVQPDAETETLTVEVQMDPRALFHPEAVVEDQGDAGALFTGEETGDTLLQAGTEEVERPVETGVSEFHSVWDENVVRVEDASEDWEDLTAEAAAAADQGTELFGYMDATPVKVSEPEAPIPLEADDAAQRLADQIGPMVEEETGSQRIELTLTPPSLGKVTVEIVHRPDGALHVALQATTERAASLLERNSSGLQSLLASQSRASVQVEVRGNSEVPLFYVNPDGQNEQQQNQQQRRRQEREQNQERQHPQAASDFISQLRLGLVELSGVAAGY